MKIRVNPHNVEIIREQTEPINEKEIKISKCEFEFDDKITNDFVKEAYFTLNGETYKQIIQNNECEYPSEVLDKKGTLEIGVVAYKVENEQEIVRYNPSPDYFESWVGSLKTAENSEPITPSEMEQFEQQLQDGLNDINDKIDEVDEKLDGIDTAIEETNNLNLDVSDKVDGDVTVTLTKKDASTKTVVLSDGTSLEFNWDGTKLGIKTSDEEEYTYVDLQGIQGIPGPQGEPFRIKKTYSSVAEMNADFNNMEYGDYVMIASSVEVEDNAKLYTRGESQWIFITDFSGATGIRGETGLTPSIQIGTVVSGSTPSVTRTGTDENPILNFVLQPGPQGEVGPTGLTGNGISSIEKTSTSGLVDTYTITYTNGNTTTFDVSNGNGIDRIEKTSTVGNKDTYTIYFTNGSTTTYEVANGEVTREELEEEVDRLSMIYNAFPTTTGEGEEPSINGTAEVPFKEIGLKGNTSQESTTGKNLFPKIASGSNGTLTLTANDDGSYTLNGTPSSSANFSLENKTLEAGDYTLQCKYSGTLPSNYANRVQVYSSNQSFNIFVTNELANDYVFNGTLSSNATDVQFRIRVESGFNYQNVKLYPMLVKGSYTSSTIGEFERYTGGNPAPSPDYPYPVKVVTGDNEVKVEGKNLLINNFVLGSINAYGKDDGNNTRAKSDYNIVQENSIYCFSSSNSKIYYVPYFYDENKTFISYINGWKDQSVTFTTPANTKYVRLIFKNNDTNTIVLNELTNMQLEKGSTATDFEPYQSQTYPINLGSMELCKIGDYQDYLYKENGVWYKYGAISKIVFDGSEDWSSYNDYVYRGINKQGVGNLGYCDKTIFGGQNFQYASSVKTTVQVKNLVSYWGMSDTTTTTWRTYLSNNNLIFYYPIVNPTITEITDTTLIEQLDNLEKAYSYDTQTNISQTNQDKPFIISYEAILSLKNVLEI